jgi:N-methylhydantoinase A
VALISPDGSAATKKVLSTPSDYAQAVIKGIKQLMIEMKRPVGDIEEILHGCTVATNAILEGKGARTALITTKGFRDVLELRRIRVPKLYDLGWIKPSPLVRRRHRLEVSERMGSDGNIVTPLNEADILQALEVIKAENIESVAIVFLNSFINPVHEKIAGQIVREALPDCFATLSVEVMPEIREYERTSTTVINAYLGPPVRRYIQSLIDSMAEAGLTGRLLVMQSSGGVLEAHTVMERPAEIVECGPAAGVIGAAALGLRSDYRNIITFDMGGTTAKASMVEEGRLVKTDEYEVGGGISLSSRLVKGGGYALKLPVIDISEVGAGGGSIVWFDKAGVLKVGPHSAGASPGPICYGLGGTEPTVTDANVILGYINPVCLARGSLPIDAELARKCFEEQVSKRLGQDIYEAAYGVHMVSNATMMRAIKAVSTYRGRDPRDFVLYAFGGNGAVHACEIALGLGIKRVVAPPAAGVFSALGLLLARVELHRSRAFLSPVDGIDFEAVKKIFKNLESEILKELNLEKGQARFEHFADVRYSGQAYELTIPLSAPLTKLGLAQLEAEFEREHQKTYGHHFPNQPRETVSLRVVGSPVQGPDANLVNSDAGGLNTVEGEEMESLRRVYFGPKLGLLETHVYTSRSILENKAIQGPVIIEEYEGTIVVHPYGRARLDSTGHVVIELEHGIAK